VGVPVQLYWHCWNLESAVLAQLSSVLARAAGEALVAAA
jgi:LysR family transcriptional regulator (chromosome initiation inhibitor)